MAAPYILGLAVLAANGQHVNQAFRLINQDIQPRFLRMLYCGLANPVHTQAFRPETPDLEPFNAAKPAQKLHDLTQIVKTGRVFPRMLLA